MLKMEFNSAQALYSTMLTDQEEETVVAETMHLLYQHWMKNVKWWWMMMITTQGDWLKEKILGEE
jgi:hypothetical protein